MFGQDRFDRVQEAWQAFWQGKNTRPLVAISVPKPGRAPAPALAYMAGFDGNYEAVADTLARWVESHAFVGEAIAYYPLSFGADHFAALLGLDMVLGETGDTSWVVHLDKTLDQVDIRFRPDGKWWTETARFAQTLQRKLGDAVLVAAPTLTAGLDALAAIRGSYALLYDLTDTPELVQEALCKVNEAYTQAFRAAAELFKFGAYGSVNRHGMYTTGAIGVPQCDFSCMISEEMFEEFAVNSIVHEMQPLDAVEYHLDGPGAIRHLERLAKIDKLDIIQWVPGAGEASEKDWTSLYQRAVELGKGLILGGNAQNILRLCDALPSRKLFFHGHGFETVGQAEDFLAALEKRYEGKA
ncbi:MAG TPA: hypothetical protein PKE04_15445 [Clostridia bacterium]|nr:hypothetical protein [Clostridia bacterium]